MTRRTPIAALALGLASFWPAPHLGAQNPVDETGEEIVATFSIVGRCARSGVLGVAVCTAEPAVGGYCPFVRAWDERLVDLGSEYMGQGVGFGAISSNDPAQYPTDDFAHMQERAQELGMPYPYLYDEAQDVARAYGAERTPEIFLFDAAGKLRYHGTIDDNYEDESAVQSTYFRDALAAARSQRTAEMSDWGALVLASMIEKESEKPDGRGLVSPVFHNRLQRGMLMQCDPTIIYGLVLDGRYRGKIYLADLSDPHAYNTYIHAGLPPGPIANPGLMSLNAAFAPAESDYLFFCAKPGHGQGHAFSTRLRDHNLAVQALRRHEQSIR